MRNRFLLVGLTMLPALLGCEPRVEEPRPRDRTPASAPAEAEAPPSKPKAKKACVQETPAEPVRTVTGPVPAPGCPADPGPVPKLAHAKVRFVDAPSAPSIDAEVAESDPDRQRGLMYRTSMPDTEGMVFIFEHSKKLSFWMHNTCIPLDMLFVAEDGTIVNIEENTPTLTDQTFPSGCPAKYVVEVNAGWTRARGVKAGQKLAIER